MIQFELTAHYNLLSTQLSSAFHPLTDFNRLHRATGRPLTVCVHDTAVPPPKAHLDHIARLTRRFCLGFVFLPFPSYCFAAATVIMPGILPMKVIKVGNNAQTRIAQACDR